MSDVRISDLPSIPTGDISSDDVIPIVDITSDTTKKISIAQFDARYGSTTITGNVVGVNIGVSSGTGRVVGAGNMTISIPQPVGPSDSPIFNVLGANRLVVDNIEIDGSTIRNQDVNGSLNLQANGTGKINIQSLIKILSNLELDEQTNSQSGTDVTLAGLTKPIVSLDGALTSIENITGASQGRLHILTNKTGNIITVKNGSGIITGTGLDLNVNINSSIWVYLASDGNWYIIGGSGGGGGASALEDLTDVNINTPLDGQVLTRQGLEWINSTPTPAPVISVNGKVDVVVLDLDDINDVTITTPIDGQVLSYQSGQWVNQTLPSAPVTSVNGQTDVVVLDADDIEYTSGFSVADELGSLGVRVGTAEGDIDALELQALDFVKGPGFAASTDGNLAAFDMTSGRLIKEVPVNATNVGNVTTPGNLAVRSIDTQESTILGDSKSFFKTLGLWTKYKNVVPGPTPEPDPLGTPDADFTFTHDDSNTNPYGTIGSLRIGKPSLSGDVQGNGGFLNQFIEKAMRGAWAEFSYSHINLGGYIPNSLKVFVYDVTNSAWLDIVGDANVPANEGIHRIKFYIPSNTANLRIFTHMTSTEASTLMAKLIVGYDIKPVDPVSVPQAVIGGGEVSKITTDQTGIASGTPTKITFNNTNEPAFGGMVWNASRNSWDVAQTGRLLVNAQVFWSTISIMANLSVWVYKNGVQYGARSGNATTGSYSPTTQANFSIPVVAGDYIEIYVQQNSGSPMSVRADSLATIFAVTLLSDQNTTQGLAVNANPRRETKFLDSNLTASASNIASLRFDDLKIGTLYKISMYMSTANNGVNNLMGGLEYTNNGVRVLNNQQEISAISGSGYTSQSRVPIVREAYFTAASTSLIANTIGSLSGRVIYGSAGNDTVNTYSILEEVVNPSMLMATPEAKMRVEGFTGYGSTNTYIPRIENNIAVNRPGSFFTFSSSAALGSSFSILVKGRYRVRLVMANATTTTFSCGISVNGTGLNDNVNLLSYNNGYRDSGNPTAQTGFPSVSAWEGALNPTDIVRPHVTAPITAGGGNTTYFEIEFLGYVS